MTYKGLIIVIILSTILILGKTISFCIDEIAGEYSEACAANEGLSVCCNTSLQHLVHGLNQKHNVSITLLSNITIHGVIYVKNFNKMMINGHYGAEITCQGKDDTGIYFEAVTDLTIRNLSINGCHMLQNSSTYEVNDPQQRKHIMCIIYIINCCNLSIDYTAIHHNEGTGMVIYDTGGNVQITNSIFEANQVPKSSNYSGGGGLNIQFTNNCFNDDKSCGSSMYLIKDCIFQNNYNFEVISNVTTYSEFKKGLIQGLGRGGGLCFILLGQSQNNNITITGCKFINNNATTWGGGLYISLRNFPVNNSLVVSHSEFRENKCIEEGGGGAKVALLTYNGRSSNNTIVFLNCTFSKNRAKKYGGGIIIVVSRESRIRDIAGHLDNTIHFDRCNWTENTAAAASAVDISPGIWDILGNGVLPVPCFLNCNFERNLISKNKTKIKEGVTQIEEGDGTFVISNFAVDLSGYINFTDNRGTGMYLQSGIVSLLNNSRLIFINNTAKCGGAIVFNSFSVMYMQLNVSIQFIENKAIIKGGAIYATATDIHERDLSRSCFLQTDRDVLQEENRNVKIIFSNNIAKSNIANSIYVNSFKPCQRDCINGGASNNSFNFLRCIGNITGLDFSSDKSVSTQPRKFNYAKDTLTEWVPGQHLQIPIAAFDEFDQELVAVYDASLEEHNSMELDATNVPYISNGSLRLKANGFMEESNVLQLNYEQTTISIDITTIECLPGWYISDNNCMCGQSQFVGIWNCSLFHKVAWLARGFWIGLCNSSEQCSGPCPPGFCIDDNTIELNMRIKNTDTLCSNKRAGKLCGRCKENNSVYYHSNTLKCSDEKLCSYGVLFYLLSEILPLTILFIVIITCNISFTSGTVSGFILYAQILDSLAINFNIAEVPKMLREFHQFIYTMFNLNFFSLDSLSFCLWKGATTLDIIAFKYVTIVYALLLILATVFLLNTTTCKKLCICWRPHSLKNAVVHGFTAFLVMCYSQCARVSFQLLTTVKLSKFNSKYEEVIFFSGEDKLFESIHLKYGITAIAFILFIVIAPPLLLLLYPMCFKILALCKLSELKIVNCMANIIPMQLFDSFQSCYKDNYRFFSGLYFLYRIIPLVLYAVCTDMAIFYYLIEVLLILALSLNGILQPYKKSHHNKTDSLLFTNLAIINIISLFNYQNLTDGKDKAKFYDTISTAFIIIQMILIYLPLVYILINVIRFIVKWLRKKITERKLLNLDYNNHALLESAYLPPLRERGANITDYNEML